ncbi:hypothetical protein GCE9029_03009 [Grimontia celer]|uniref:Lipoprotein n=1 Tax=Grimontia celer TaxID=1796497 RepID=A0A128F5M7_9GAMM|nr:hypothetical protein [Grimontia celer]CZF82068.1 hypothetical protein GCE9029_03009 [Grimontia celer]
MKRNSVLTSIAAAMLLAGCGGGDSTATDSQSGTSNDGIYLDPTMLSVMLVDTTRDKYPVILANYDTSAILVADSAISSSNSLTTKGITAVEGANGTFVYDENIGTTINFANNSASLDIDIPGYSTTVTMEKTADSLQLADIVGTHTNMNDGSTWTVYEDGSFDVNGQCTIGGRLERKSSYFNITWADATQCWNSGFDGTYEYGAIMTVTKDGQSYIAGVIGRSDSMIWGSAPIN